MKIKKILDKKHWSKFVLLLISIPLLLTGFIVWEYLNGNFHTVIAHRVYRSGQLTANQLEDRIVKLNLKSVINLRGEQPEESWYREEKAIIKRHGLMVGNINMTPRRLPQSEEVVALLDFLHKLPEPILIHCKQGADRTGFACVAAKMVLGGVKFSRARHQLSLRFGHFPFGPCAPIAHFYDMFDKYLIAEDKKGTSDVFEKWARTIYSPSE